MNQTTPPALSELEPRQSPPADHGAAAGTPHSAPHTQHSPWLPAASLAARELIRFFRQPGRVFGAVGQPLIFWLLFGAGLRTFRAEALAGASYAEYFYPGVLGLILLFTAIFATISIIEDRREGFLQAVLVAPVPRSSLVLGKVLGGTMLAVIQGGLLLALAPLAGISPSVAGVAAALGIMFLVAFALTALGFCLAWRADSVAGFHAVMSVLLFPMWLLSGAFFPIPPENSLLAWLMRVNPLTYGIAAVRRALYLGDRPPPGGHLPTMLIALAVTAAFGALMFALATRQARRPGVRVVQ